MRINRVDKRNGILRTNRTDKRKGLIEIAVYSQYFGSMHQSLRELAQRNLATRNQHCATKPSMSCIGCCGSGSIAGRSTHHNTLPGLHSLAHCHRHASIFERTGWIEAFIFGIESDMRTYGRSEPW